MHGLLFGAATTLVSLASLVNGQCQNIGGNYYCSETNYVEYQSVGYSGSYNKVTSFNQDGTCSYEPFGFGGSLAPLDEEVSVHFRGPIALKQFAFYQLNGNTVAKRDVNEQPHHVHKREAEPEPAYVTEFVYLTRTVLNGKTQIAAAVETSLAVPPVQPVPSSSSTPAPAPQSSSSAVSNVPPTTLAISSSAAAPSSSSSPSNGWSRAGYYNSQSGTADGIVFMNHQGGAGSGVWDIQFGNSISYAGSDGVSCASSPQVLSDTTVGNNNEFIIFSGQQCNNGDCGFYRPGIPAYHGFGGSNRLFLFEFGMPNDDSSAAANVDMPAIWLLNSQIPRTLQYGAPSCSCWSTGCGEFDLFEVLSTGSNFLTNHVHTMQGLSKKRDTVGGGGGTPNYFARPTSGTMKAAVILTDDAQTLTIVRLDPNTNFDEDLSIDTVQEWINSPSGGGSNTYIGL